MTKKAIKTPTKTIRRREISMILSTLADHPYSILHFEFVPFHTHSGLVPLSFGTPNRLKMVNIATKRGRSAFTKNFALLKC
jgi:hypothetical protein